MSGRDVRSRTRRIVSLLTLTFLFLRAQDAFSESQAPRVEISDPAALSGLSEVLSNAVHHARSKLSESACSQIFTDYRDAGGRMLQANLDALERTGESYMSWLNFYNGNGLPRCGNRGTLAFTSPGSRNVYICFPQFRETQLREPGVAAAIVIHEELHSLGLSENPPSSKTITARVISRCGR